jgi:hypothetical protein
LLRTNAGRLTALKARADSRAALVELVRASLPAPLAAAVVSAGLEGQRLTVGVAGAAWAARIRYQSDHLCHAVGLGLDETIHRMRVRVVPPAPARPASPAQADRSVETPRR